MDRCKRLDQPMREVIVERFSSMSCVRQGHIIDATSEMVVSEHFIHRIEPFVRFYW